MFYTPLFNRISLSFKFLIFGQGHISGFCIRIQITKKRVYVAVLTGNVVLSSIFFEVRERVLIVDNTKCPFL